MRPSLIPSREYVANAVVCHLPIAAMRMSLYRLLGINMAEPGSTNILMATEVHAPRRIEIGPGTTIGRHCLLDGRGGLRIGAQVNISSFTLLITGTHDPHALDFAGRVAPVTIGDYAWLATRVMVLPGCSIGAGAVVAAGAVVTADVAPYTIVGGVPATKLGDRRQDLDYSTDFRLNWT
jgi:acetyltransferase-like isoleucine patch superfamily enzyme